MWYVVKVGHPAFELRAVLERDFVDSHGNGGPGVDFFLAGTGTTAGSVGTDCREFPHGVFDSVTKKNAVHAKVTYGVGGTFEFAFES